jgi:hypothetical protein
MKMWRRVLERLSSLVLWISNKRLNWQKREKAKNNDFVNILDTILIFEIMKTEWYIKINEKKLTYVDRCICTTFYS